MTVRDSTWKEHQQRALTPTAGKEHILNLGMGNGIPNILLDVH